MHEKISSRPNTLIKRGGVSYQEKHSCVHISTSIISNLFQFLRNVYNSKKQNKQKRTRKLRAKNFFLLNPLNPS